MRHEQRQFLVEGAQAIGEALAEMRAAASPVPGQAGNVVVRELFVSAEAAAHHQDLVSAAQELLVPVRMSAEEVFAALSDTVTPQGMVAVCDFLDQPLSDILDRAPQLVVLLAEVRDPGNAGSVIRAADAAGADAVVFSTGSVDPYNSKVVRASVGGLFHLAIAADVDVTTGIEQLRAAGLQVLAADGGGSVSLDDANSKELLVRPTAWVFGNEARGLTPDVRDASDEVVAIPIYGRAESLNLATAATLCLYASARAMAT
ncbi:MAG TPA: RNA methyltransferase [Actinomycetes bacterium]|nr:RNA methyltransferase [Actinomycetes bacterium]